MQNNYLHCLPVLHGCGLHYNDILSGLSVKQEVKGLTTNYITVHYPGRKPVYLQIIGAAASKFHLGLTTSELKGLMKKLSFVILSRHKV